MSVSTRTSATVPFAAVGRFDGRVGAEGGGQRGRGVGLEGEVRVEGSTNDLGHGHAFRNGELVDVLALFVGQVDLSTSCWHTALIYSMRRRHTHPVMPGTSPCRSPAIRSEVLGIAHA